VCDTARAVVLPSAEFVGVLLAIGRVIGTPPHTRSSVHAASPTSIASVLLDTLVNLLAHNSFLR
jgi:hypothetical protein